MTACRGYALPAAQVALTLYHNCYQRCSIFRTLFPLNRYQHNPDTHSKSLLQLFFTYLETKQHLSLEIWESPPSLLQWGEVMIAGCLCCSSPQIGVWEIVNLTARKGQKDESWCSHISGFTLAEHTRLKKETDYAYVMAHLLIFFFFSLSSQAPSCKKVAS